MKQPKGASNPKLEVIEVSDEQIANYYNEMARKAYQKNSTLKRNAAIKRGRPKKVKYSNKKSSVPVAPEPEIPPTSPDLPEDIWDKVLSNNIPIDLPEKHWDLWWDLLKPEILSFFVNHKIPDEYWTDFIKDLNYYFQGVNDPHELEYKFGPIFYQKYFSKTKPKSTYKESGN